MYMLFLAEVHFYFHFYSLIFFNVEVSAFGEETQTIIFISFSIRQPRFNLEFHAHDFLSP